ncbi:hypothetical protein ACQUQU_13585 [Thalassolituus sp. LLYu03]|uniref:hypothetical protein n=1 Tax=Thalassolituus sp. LLYu03 TaxID=3421656 RepID=UPI003D29ED36
MKAHYLSLALLAASATTLAQGPDMTFVNNDGSVLTINNFMPSGNGPMNVPGSYMDNSGLGGCPKGNTYNVNLTVTGDPANSSVSFKSPLCTGVKLTFSGQFPVLPPMPSTPPPPGSESGGIPVPTITATLKVSATTTTKSTYNPQM